jgi:hypothetical protein
MSTTSPPTESSNFFSLWLNNFETQAQNPTTADVVGALVGGASAAGGAKVLGTALEGSLSAEEAERAADLTLTAPASGLATVDEAAENGASGLFSGIAAAALGSAAGWTAGEASGQWRWAC